MGFKWHWWYQQDGKHDMFPLLMVFEPQYSVTKMVWSIMIQRSVHIRRTVNLQIEQY